MRARHRKLAGVTNCKPRYEEFFAIRRVLRSLTLPARWDHDQRRQRVLPSLWRNSFEPGRDRVVPGFPWGWHSEEKCASDRFTRYMILPSVRLSPIRRVNPSRSSLSKNGTMTRRELPSACRNSLTVAGPFLTMKSPTATSYVRNSRATTPHRGEFQSRFFLYQKPHDGPRMRIRLDHLARRRVERLFRERFANSCLNQLKVGRQLRSMGSAGNE